MEYTPSAEEHFTNDTWAGIDQAGGHHYSYSSNYYFESYAHYGIHEDMIKDTVRTDTYRRAIQGNSYLFRGKTVLDVGCGTGILSFFALTAGASKIYSIDSSDIIEYAKRISEANNFQDKIVFIRGKVEDIELPEQVDIIISE